MIGDRLTAALRNLEHACLAKVVALSPSICDGCPERDDCTVRLEVLRLHGGGSPEEVGYALAGACPKRRPPL